ncbi:hypothetical protein EJ04DRAFT_464400 [Polyplosphaeria fusca]|uniref:Uncharacterized protein n=1 Tax=Polyplosphaeria fusca TaxID=682080 RepID=A0A9P4QZB8_9PLEO|nr:hypothetical protein EJ04DRAFT_464400 [Polyplosphaeria fusca]
MASFGGTEFLSMLSPQLLKDWDNTKPYNEQASSIPQIFKDAMAVREEVYGEQGVPLEAEFDEDDPRSWHWVVYASVASTSSPPPDTFRADGPVSKAEDARRASATGQRVAVGTIRLIPPPHAPNKYAQHDKHSDAGPPPGGNVDGDVAKSHPKEPYVKLGRLAVLEPYRALGLSQLLINTALEYASKHPENIQPPPSPTLLEQASQQGKHVEESYIWKGLTMVHAQTSVAKLWKKYGFSEELVDEHGKVETAKEEHWWEEGIEHLGMWRRLKVDHGRL